MTTPGGCSDIPTSQVSGGSGPTSYSVSHWTPSQCAGTDFVAKTWNDGSTNFASVLPQDGGQTNQPLDFQYGSTNTATIAAVTAVSLGGYHAAARYCKELDFGGYSDWFLPNEDEMFLLLSSNASGIDPSGRYLTSTEYSPSQAMISTLILSGVVAEDSSPYDSKNAAYLVRCMRRY
jgi:hypothetical protein